MRPLSSKQLFQLLAYYAEGYRVDDIAGKEHLSVHAVNNRLKKVKAVMGCRTTTQAVAKAIAEGDLVVLHHEHGEYSIHLKEDVDGHS